MPFLEDAYPGPPPGARAHTMEPRRMGGGRLPAAEGRAAAERAGAVSDGGAYRAIHDVACSRHATPRVILALGRRLPILPVSRPSFSRVPPGMHSMHLYNCHSVSAHAQGQVNTAYARHTPRVWAGKCRKTGKDWMGWEGRWSGR